MALVCLGRSWPRPFRRRRRVQGYDIITLVFVLLSVCLGIRDSPLERAHTLAGLEEHEFNIEDTYACT